MILKAGFDEAAEKVWINCSGKQRKVKSITMGHYCRICGRTRANEKFSGKGHKNHVCKDCSGKVFKKANKNGRYKNELVTDSLILIEMHNQTENMYLDENWFYFDADFELENIDDENNEELPF